MKTSKAFTRAQRVASFLSRIDIKGPNECWLWKGCTYNCGYGSFSWRGKMRGANIVAWEIAHGKDVPEGLDVLHTCDKPLCVNPMHLWAGTHQDNMLDAHRKQRCTIDTLTPIQVREIRAALARPYFGIGRDLAAKYGVSQVVISKIRVGGTYNWVM